MLRVGLKQGVLVQVEMGQAGFTHEDFFSIISL